VSTKPDQLQLHATTPSEFGASLDTADARFAEVISAAGIKAEDARPTVTCTSPRRLPFRMPRRVRSTCAASYSNRPPLVHRATAWIPGGRPYSPRFATGGEIAGMPQEFISG